ncbi:unnamed protein product [Amaranthus hypochondriacus]
MASNGQSNTPAQLDAQQVDNALTPTQHPTTYGPTTEIFTTNAAGGAEITTIQVNSDPSKRGSPPAIKEELRCFDQGAMELIPRTHG